MADTTAVTAATTQQTAIFASKRSNVQQMMAQMQAMQAANMGGGVGGGYSMSGKTKIEVNKEGRFIFTDPFTGKLMGHKQLRVATVLTKFQLQRWLGEKEVIDGIDPDNQKGPLCRSIGYTNPAPSFNDQGQVMVGPDGKPVHEWDSTGWWYQPAYSAYHAVKMLPDLRGHGGWDGKQGEIACKDCPLSKQGLKGEDAKCKPTGMDEVVIFMVGDEVLPKPVYGVVKLSVVNIIAYGDYLDRIAKKYKVNTPEGLMALPITSFITTIEANKSVEKNRTFARIEFDVYSRVDEAIQKQVDDAIDETEKIIAEAEEAEKAKNGEKTGSGLAGAGAAASGPSSGEAF